MCGDWHRRKREKGSKCRCPSASFYPMKLNESRSVSEFLFLHDKWDDFMQIQMKYEKCDIVTVKMSEKKFHPWFYSFCGGQQAKIIKSFFACVRERQLEVCRWDAWCNARVFHESLFAVAIDVQSCFINWFNWNLWKKLSKRVCIENLKF